MSDKVITFYAQQLSERPSLAEGRQWTEDLFSADVVVVKDLSIVQQAREKENWPFSTWLTIVILEGKRVATPAYCSSTKPAGGTSILFQPALKGKQFKVFLTPHFQANHKYLTQRFRRWANELGKECRVEELETEDNAVALGPKKAMVINNNIHFSDFLRKVLSFQRQRGERGAFRSG